MCLSTDRDFRGLPAAQPPFPSPPPPPPVSPLSSDRVFPNASLLVVEQREMALAMTE